MLLLMYFLDSGGTHAAASVVIAYVRPLFLKFSFGAAYDYQAIKFSASRLYSRRFIYFLLLIRHSSLVLFSLVVFDQD